MLDAIAKPFGWLMLWLYEFIGDYGLAVIAFALIVKLILWPFMAKSKRSTLRSARLQPKMKELEKKHGANKQKYNEELQKLYREEGVNPMSGCLWALIPFPILLALYQAIRKPITIMMGVGADLLANGGALLTKLTDLGYTASGNNAYAEISQAQFITSNWSSHSSEFLSISDKLKPISFNIFGVVDLGAQPDWKFLWNTNWSDPSVWVPGLCLFMIPVIAAILTYVASKVTMKMTPQPQDSPNNMQAMNVVMPIVTLWFAFVMPAALGLYWIASSGFGILQDIVMTKRAVKQLNIEDADRLELQSRKEAELEAKRQETERLKAENATLVNPNTSKKKQQIKAREEQAARAAEYEKRVNPTAAEEPSRVENRRFARGRAYDPSRYGETAQPDGGAEDAPAAPDGSAAAAQPLPDSAEQEDDGYPDDAAEQNDAEPADSDAEEEEQDSDRE